MEAVKHECLITQENLQEKKKLGESIQFNRRKNKLDLGI
jgi:hypothetical protein